VVPEHLRCDSLLQMTMLACHAQPI